MHRAIVCLAALQFACLGAAPASAQQVVEGLYEVADPNAPLTFLQRQALAEVRERDRATYIYIARDAGIAGKTPNRTGIPSIKPIVQWTQGDLWRFRDIYDSLASRPPGLEKWSAHEMATLIQHLTNDSGGEGDD